MSPLWEQNIQRLGRRVQSFGRALRQPGRLKRRLTGVYVDEDLMELVTRPYIQAGDVRTVLDVGANEGQFARTALDAFPAAKIYCFEPQPSLRATLQRLADDHVGRLEVEGFALGDSEGTIDFNVTSFSPSSSILTPEHQQSVPIAVAETTRVPIARLSAWASSRMLAENILLKLDVQGYEATVLRGGLDFLRRVRVVIAETTFASLYKGQSSMGDLCSILEPLGFSYREAFGIVRDSETGIPLWQDSVFVRGADSVEPA